MRLKHRLYGLVCVASAGIAWSGTAVAAPPCHGAGKAVVRSAVAGELLAPGFDELSLVTTGFDGGRTQGGVGVPDYLVTIQDFAYTPSDLTVERGSVVRWTNMDFFAHTITSQTGPDVIEPSGLFSGSVDVDQSFDYQFNDVGEFWYFCIPHGPFMQGVVRVILLGDMNCDGVVSVSDIGGFVLALTDPAGYQMQFPDCDISHADINNDDQITVSDIGPFVQALTGG